jgi:hypothetical protein
MRLALLAVALLLCGCAGMKLGGGYRFDTKEFFINIEKPIGGFKK